MSTNLTHLEQYKLLREETIFHLKANSRTEFYCAIAVGTIYGWLILHRTEPIPSLVKYIPVMIISVCALRCLDLMLQIKSIGKYLLKIEEISFTDVKEPPGWERYLRKKDNRFLKFAGDFASISIWALAIILSLFLSASL